jgi:short-subunit dehydrogenase
MKPYVPPPIPDAMPDLGAYGPWAVVAGGSEGVGAEFARLLATAGINLVLIARKPGPLEQTAERCRDLGAEVRTLAVDLTAAGTVDRIAAVTSDLEVGLLVCNAGADSAAAPYVDSEPRHVERLIALNITMPLALVRLFGGPMRDRGRGGILLTGSLSGDAGQAHHAVYGATKAFTRVFAEGLWAELAGHGVDVLELVLGLTRTPAMERLGVPFDLPGVPVSEPADVAYEGLAMLASGPVRYAGDTAAGLDFRWHPDRRKVVSKLNRALADAFGGAVG